MMRKCHHKPHRPAVVPPRCNLDPRTPVTTWNPGSLQAMIALGLAVLAALLAAPEGRAQTPNPNPPPAATPPPSAKALHDWRKGMARVPTPKKGCFTSSYPSTEWQEVPCTTAPARPYPPARGGGRPDQIGNGNDVSAQVTTGHISEAIGSFDSARLAGSRVQHRRRRQVRLAMARHQRQCGDLVDERLADPAGRRGRK